MEENVNFDFFGDLIKGYIQEIIDDKPIIKNDTRLGVDLGMDSLDRLLLMNKLDKHFNAHFNANETDKLWIYDITFGEFTKNIIECVNRNNL